MTFTFGKEPRSPLGGSNSFKSTSPGQGPLPATGLTQDSGDDLAVREQAILGLLSLPQRCPEITNYSQRPRCKRRTLSGALGKAGQAANLAANDVAVKRARQLNESDLDSELNGADARSVDLSLDSNSQVLAGGARRKASDDADSLHGSSHQGLNQQAANCGENLSTTDKFGARANEVQSMSPMPFAEEQTENAIDKFFKLDGEKVTAWMEEFLNTEVTFATLNERYPHITQADFDAINRTKAGQSCLKLLASQASVLQSEPLKFTTAQLVSIAKWGYRGGLSIARLLLRGPSLMAPPLKLTSADLFTIAKPISGNNTLETLYCVGPDLIEAGYTKQQLVKIASVIGASQTLQALYAVGQDLLDAGYERQDLVTIASCRGASQALLNLRAIGQDLQNAGYTRDNLVKIAAKEGGSQALQNLNEIGQELMHTGYQQKDLVRISGHHSGNSALLMLHAVVRNRWHEPLGLSLAEVGIKLSYCKGYLSLRRVLTDAITANPAQFLNANEFLNKEPRHWLWRLMSRNTEGAPAHGGSVAMCRTQTMPATPPTTGARRESLATRAPSPEPTQQIHQHFLVKAMQRHDIANTAVELLVRQNYSVTPFRVDLALRNIAATSLEALVTGNSIIHSYPIIHPFQFRRMAQQVARAQGALRVVEQYVMRLIANQDLPIINQRPCLSLINIANDASSKIAQLAFGLQQLVQARPPLVHP